MRIASEDWLNPLQPNSVVGKHAIIPEDMEGALLNQNVVRISPKNNDVLDKRFLSFLGQSSIFKNYIAQNARGFPNQSRRSISAFKEMLVNLPDIQPSFMVNASLFFSLFIVKFQNPTRHTPTR